MIASYLSAFQCKCCFDDANAVSTIVGCVGADQKWNILQSRLAKMERDMLWDDLRSFLAVEAQRIINEEYGLLEEQNWLQPLHHFFECRKPSAMPMLSPVRIRSYLKSLACSSR
jgi:hypothetical protein